MTQRHMRGGVAWTMTLLLAAGFCGLGVWQLQRMHEKQDLLDQAAQARRQLLPLAQGLAGAAVGPQSVHGRGEWLPMRVLLDNQIRHGQAGLRVYQPLRAVQGGATVLVDLGWKAWPPDRRMPDIPVARGGVSVRGLLVAPPSSGLALGPAMTRGTLPDSWLATRLELPEVGRVVCGCDISSRVLRLDPALPVGFERDLELLSNTLPPSRHLGYAVQWFAMALALLVIVGTLRWRRRTPRNGH